MNLAQLQALGFDGSTQIRFTRTFDVRCSCCEALVINGTPTHERGCPNAKHECAGCSNIVPANQKYCEDCR